MKKNEKAKPLVERLKDRAKQLVRIKGESPFIEWDFTFSEGKKGKGAVYIDRIGVDATPAFRFVTRSKVEGADDVYDSHTLFTVGFTEFNAGLVSLETAQTAESNDHRQRDVDGSLVSFRLSDQGVWLSQKRPGPTNESSTKFFLLQFEQLEALALLMTKAGVK